MANRKNQTKLQGQIIATQHSGPLPQASELAEYDVIHPGFADRIVTMAEKEQSHRHIVEQNSVKGFITERRIGQIFAFTIVISAIASGSYLIYKGHSVAGLFCGVGAIGTIIMSFLNRNR